MVQANAAKPAFQRPDPVRIAAMSGALSLNLGALFLLLIPIVMPSAPPRVEESRIDIIFPPDPVEVQPVPPIPPAPRIERRQVVRQPIPTPTPETPAVDNPVVAEPYTPPVTVTTDPVAPTVSGPVEAGALAVVVGTPPRYPMRALRAGIEGTVYLRILVGTDGLPISVEVDKSSGNRELDSEAKRHVLKKWRFQPAMRDGVPVEAWGRVPVVFTLARA